MAPYRLPCVSGSEETMNLQTFISIGTKGTSLPLRLTEITPPLAVGINGLRWADPGKVPEAERAHGWVSNNGKPFELYPLEEALRQGRVQLFRAAWVGRVDGKRHVGEVFFPHWWKQGDEQPLLVAARADSWGPGCVESKLNPDRRNLAAVARLDPGSFQPADYSPVSEQEPAPVAENWTDDELRAVVAAYLQMLHSEQMGQPYRKADYNARLRTDALATRSKASVEYRMQNISATLAEIGHPWIEGYKPQSNVGQGVKARLFALLLDAKPEEFTAYEPSADDLEVARRTGTLLHGTRLQKPVGEKVPKTVERTTSQFLRSPAVQAFVRRQAAGKCELCRKPAPFLDENGDPFLEVHHVVHLADHGSDTVENAAALCPDCHRQLHHGKNRVTERARLYAQVSRLRPSN